MAEQQPQPASKAQVLNDRTYQEVEYLKKNLGPILVAALAEICIRRPADPIEYLGHWLLRWRYNEELKRRDVQNALEVVRQKAWSKDDGSLQPAETQGITPQSFTQGFTPNTPYAPPGFGGPLDANVTEQPQPEQPAAQTSAEKTPSVGEKEKALSQTGGSGEMAAAAAEAPPPAEDAPKQPSGEVAAEAPPAEAGQEEKRSSRKSGIVAPEGSAVDAAPPAEEAPPAEAEPAPEAEEAPAE